MNKNKLEKIILNTGVGRFSTLPNFEEKTFPAIVEEFSVLAGQKPEARQAKKSIAGFKLRAGTVVGLKTTLRGIRMDNFFKKLLNATLPRIRDFRGISKTSIDGNGNLTIGIKDHLVFPELNPEASKVNFGLEITMVPKIPIRDQVKAIEFYQSLRVPFKKNNDL